MVSFKRDRLNRRVLSDLRKRSAFGIAFYIGLAFIVLFSNGFYTRHPVFSLHFASWITGICMFRYAHLPISRWAGKSHETLNNVLFLASVGLTSLIWGAVFARFMVLEGEQEVRLLMAICTIGLCAGGVVSYMPSLRLSIFFNFSMLLPAMVLMVWQQVDLPLAVSILLFSAYLVLMAFRANREYWTALENEFLLRKKSEELNTLSRIDVLTGLYNRRHFDEKFDHEWKRATRHQERLTLLICDIDHFKTVNDQHGHLAGDEFLKLAASVLKETFQRDTDIAARYGGEEFVVLLTDTNPESAFEMAERVRRRMAAIFLVYNGHRITATISIGIASTIPGYDEEQEALIGNADQALYAAKQEGRNRTVTDLSMPRNAGRRPEHIRH